MGLSTKIAAYLNSAFWACLVAGPLSAIVCSLKFSPHIMVFGNLICCTASLILLLLFYNSTFVLWFGSMIFAFSIASIYSSTITYAKGHITMTGKRLSILIIAATLGDATVPLLVGITLNSTIFAYPTFIIVILFIMILASMIFTANVLCFLSRTKSSLHADDIIFKNHNS